MTKSNELTLSTFRFLFWVLILVIAALLAIIVWGMEIDAQSRRYETFDVQWIGNVVVGELEEGGRYVSTSLVTSIEIGLKPDGTLAWRKLPVKPHGQ